MGTIAAGNLAQKWYDGYGWTSFGSGAAYAGWNNSGSGQGYVTCLRVRMPGTGTAAQLQLRYTFDYGVNSNKKLRWKVTTAAADGTYAGASGGTAGDGESAVTSGSGTVTVSYTGSFFEGSYLYVYLWGTDRAEYTLSTVSAVASHTCTYTEGTASGISFSGSTIGSAIGIHISRNNSGFTHRLEYSFLGHSGVIAQSAETYCAWTPDRATFAGWMPTRTSGTCTVTCTTYLGSACIGTSTGSLTLVLPGDMVPAVSAGWAVGAIDNSGTAAAGLRCGVQGHSRVRVTFSPGAVTHAAGATLGSFTVSVQGKSCTAAASGNGYAAVTAPISVSGTVTVSCKCTDSRGRSTSGNVTVELLPYAEPVLRDVQIFRCDSAGTADEEGSYLSLRAGYTVSPLGGANSASLWGTYKPVSGSWQTETAMTASTAVILGGSLSYAASYLGRIRVADTLGFAAQTQVTIPTASAAFHIREGGRGAAFFGYSETDGEVTVHGRIAADNLADTVVETGTGNGWTYRKWQSGRMTMEGQFTAGYTITNAWGNLYISDIYTPAAYPVAFTASPMVWADGEYAGSLLLGTGRSGSGSAAQAPGAMVCRPVPTGSAGPIKYHYYAVGKWK